MLDADTTAAAKFASFAHLRIRSNSAGSRKMPSEMLPPVNTLRPLAQVLSPPPAGTATTRQGAGPVPPAPASSSTVREAAEPHPAAGGEPAEEVVVADPVALVRRERDAVRQAEDAGEAHAGWSTIGRTAMARANSAATASRPGKRNATRITRGFTPSAFRAVASTSRRSNHKLCLRT